MRDDTAALKNLEYEAQLLIARLGHVKSFSMNMPMVAAAALPSAVLNSVETFFERKREDNCRAACNYLKTLHDMKSEGKGSPERAQRLFTALRMRFNNFLSQYDIFSDVITQRGEHENGVFLSGLDEAARDALRLPGNLYRSPPMMCYLEKGYGGAIRRIKTKLPGGDKNPTTIIRIPRERMISGGIASSLVHEVGHQGAALLDLVAPLKLLLKKRIQGDSDVMRFFHIWVSEALADLWSVSKVGIGSTLGLMGVISLPRPFMFRLGLDDPHPTPWIRVKMSCAMGNALYPDQQWNETAMLWEKLYPLHRSGPSVQSLVRKIEQKIPIFVDLILGYRPASLKGKKLFKVFSSQDRKPSVLRNHYQKCLASGSRLKYLPPTLAFAVLGQARKDGRLSPIRECRLIENLLKGWALRKKG